MKSPNVDAVVEMKTKLSKLSKNWKKPGWWKNILLYKMIFPYMYRTNEGVNILAESWNNLIILDDCRYDSFLKVYKNMNIRGKLEYKISKGTNTAEFLRETFTEKKYDEIIYITANPIVSKFLKGKFYKIIPIWDAGWDETHQTVSPLAVYKCALETIKKFPNKKIIIHFLQPHSPYPNGYGECKFKSEINSIMGGKTVTVKFKIGDNCLIDWPYVGFKKLDARKIIEGYELNLKRVLFYVKELIEYLPGNTIVTSDHGEAFGEKIHTLIPIKIYGHIQKVRMPVLVKVPWLIIRSEEKKLKTVKDIEKKLEYVGATNQQQKMVREQKKLKSKIKSLKLKGKI